MPSFPSPSLEGRRNGTEEMEAKRGRSLLLSVLPVGRPRARRRNRHLPLVCWPTPVPGLGRARETSPSNKPGAGGAPAASGSQGAVTGWFVPQQGGAAISPTFPWELAPVTHRNSSDIAEIAGRRQVRAPSLLLDRVSKPMQHGNGTLQSLHISVFVPPCSHLSLPILLVLS